MAPEQTSSAETAAPAVIQKYYSAAARGFYSSEIHDVMPTDVVPITDELWQGLLEAQSGGKQIVPDTNGHPIAVDRIVTPEMEKEMLKSQIATIETSSLRAMREKLLDVPPEPGQPTAEERLRTLNQQMTDLRVQLRAIS